jgi:hypothetical protein
MTIKKNSFLFALLFLFQNAFAENSFLPLNCLKNYASLIKPVNELQIFSGKPLSNIKFRNPKEYIGTLPASCESELNSKGNLTIIANADEILLIAFELENSEPRLLKYLNIIDQNRIEISLKRYNVGYSAFNSTLGSNLFGPSFAFSYVLQKDKQNYFLELLTFKNIELSNYD